ncbi:MAG: hypothetical protein GF353_02730 [Candidatus Lokiarchaeota archaeon]|nr:hypothetical protein [Candidatus Lokiarchaeota archaeon]
MSAFIAPGLFCWIYSFGILVYPKTKIRIIIPYFIICLIYESLLIFFLFTNPDIIAVYEGKFSYRRTWFNIAFLVFVIATTIITGGIFAIKSISSENSIVRWKGIFFSNAIISFVLASVLDVFSVGNSVLQIITKIIFIAIGIEYCLGFFLPNRLTIALTGEKSLD